MNFLNTLRSTPLLQLFPGTDSSALVAASPARGRPTGNESLRRFPPPRFFNFGIFGNYGSCGNALAIATSNQRKKPLLYNVAQSLLIPRMWGAMRLRSITILFVSFVVVLFAGCSKKSGGDTIKIGVITSATGNQAAFGEAHKNGYAIALDEINAKGGVLGKKVELDIYDDQSKPDQAVQGVSKLVDQDHVPIILGSYSSESTKAIVPAVTQRQVPLIIPTATADNVMDSKSPWVFRICAGAADYAKATIDFLKANGAPKTMAIVYENTNFGQSNMKAMTAAAKEAGINLVAVESYEAKSPDYKSVLQRVKQANPQVIYFCSYLLDAGTLMRQSQEVDLNPPYYTSAGTGFAAAEFPTAERCRQVRRVHVFDFAVAAGS